MEIILITLLVFAILSFLVVPPWLTRDVQRYLASPLPLEAVENLAERASWDLDIVETEPGVSIPGLVRSAADSEEQWILFIPGNGDRQLASGQNYLQRLSEGASEGEGERWGLAVWGLRGYDSAGGSPNADGFHSDYRKLYQRLVEHYGANPEKIHIVGFSFGTDLALFLAAALAEKSLPPASIVLLSTRGMTSEKWKMRRKQWFYRWFIPDSYDLKEAFKRIRIPALIIESENDLLGDPEFLLNSLEGEKQFVVLPGGTHTASVTESEAIENVVQWISSFAD